MATVDGGGATLRLLPLVGRWTLRAVLTYVGLALALLLGGLLLGPEADWERLGGLGMLLGGYVAGLIFMLPPLVLIGAVQGAVVWAAFRVSGGSRTPVLVASGVAPFLLSIAFVLVYSEPRPIDLLFYAVVGVGVGLVAAWLARRDLARAQAPVEAAAHA